MKTKILILILITSCMEKEVTYSIVPDEIRPHYDNFYKEALYRGFRIRERPVRITLEEGKEDAAGTANRSQQTIHLRKSLVNYGLEENAINLEYVVFHEMAHYVLDRDHNDDVFGNGELASMMNSKKVAYTVGREHLREFYLDELFGAKIKESRR